MKVLLGMSGGVDSSVAAMLLKKQGYEVIGLSFRIWHENDQENNIELPKYLNDAKEVANKLNIEHHVYDIRSVFKDKVVNYFVDTYLRGETPFPCAICNPQVKWYFLQQKAKELHCDRIATGHYVNILEREGVYYISDGIDEDKNQSFFLWNLSQEILAKAVFPLGGYKKEKVKELAKASGFNEVESKKESIGICFLQQANYRKFLASEIENRRLSIRKGNYIDVKRNYIGKHNGYPFYTIGQRRGLGIHFNKAMYVCEIDAKNNAIVLSDKQALFKTSFKVRDYLFSDISNMDGVEVIVKIRYRKQATPATLHLINDNCLEVELKEPLDMIPPGQTAVFYIENMVIGGGFIV